MSVQQWSSSELDFSSSSMINLTATHVSSLQTDVIAYFLSSFWQFLVTCFLLYSLSKAPEYHFFSFYLSIIDKNNNKIKLSSFRSLRHETACQPIRSGNESDKKDTKLLAILMLFNPNLAEQTYLCYILYIKKIIKTWNY